jgi:hypothetical protein
MISKYSLLIVLGMLIACESKPKEEEVIEEQMIVNLSFDSVKRIEEQLIPDEVTQMFSVFDDYFKIQSKKELYAQFDSSVLKDEINWYAEGTLQKNTTHLKNPKTNHIIKFIWTDDDKAQTEWIEASYSPFDDLYKRNNGLKTKNGLYLGMPLTELENWNNHQPISFLGFEWDYSGAVMPDSISKLGQSIVKINLGLGETDDLSVLGDIEFKSNDENIKHLPIYISELIYYYE